MTPLIQRFIDEYRIDENGAAAARRAGYAPAGAKQRAYILLKRPDVTAAIASRKAGSHHGMQADEIIAILSRIARGASGEWQQLRALGMLMRHLGLFTPAKPPPEPTLLELLQAMPHPPEPQIRPPDISTAETPPSRNDPDPHPWDPRDPQPTPKPYGDEPHADEPRAADPPRVDPPRGRSNSGASPRRPVDHHHIIAANQPRAHFRASLRKPCSDDP